MIIEENPFARKAPQETGRNPFTRKSDNKIIEKSDSFFTKVDAATQDEGKQKSTFPIQLDIKLGHLHSCLEPKAKVHENEKKDSTRQTTLLGMMGRKSKPAAASSSSDENASKSTQLIGTQPSEPDVTMLDNTLDDSRSIDIEAQY
jgi:chromosome transmission fidelity protein 4